MSTGVKEEKKISFKFPWDIFSLSPPSLFRPLSLSLSLSNALSNASCRGAALTLPHTHTTHIYLTLR